MGIYAHTLHRRTFNKLFAIAAALSLSISAHPAIASGSDAFTPVKVETPIQISDAQVLSACDSLDKAAQKEVDANSVAGMAIAIVHNDKVVFAKGYGLRDTGRNEKIDPDTVFQLASVSKSVAGTVVSELVGEGKISWDSKILDLDPSFAMYEPWVTSQITIRDLFAHRSGLPDHAGDLYEDLGADRAQVLHHLRYQHPDSSFRAGYAYTNFGLTEGGVAAAKAYNMTWEEASEQKLYKPLGMTSTSSRFSDYDSRTNKAVSHMFVDGKWVHKVTRHPDAQSPAGGASSSVNDMTKWMRLQLASGKWDGKQLVDEQALVEGHHPCMLTQFNPFNHLPGFYGLGYNVNYDEKGRLRIGHSGAFAAGFATCYTLIPQADLGIVVLTNSAPVGVAEALNMEFVETALEGKTDRDWLPFFKNVFKNPAMIGLNKGYDFSKKLSAPTAPSSISTYVGTYKNDFFGDMSIAARGNGLVMTVGPKGMEFPLTHYDRDTFTWVTTGENEIGVSGVTFTVGPDGKARQVFVEHLNDTGEGTFTRK